MAMDKEEADRLCLAMKLPLVRHGVTFQQCLMESIGVLELVKNFDRLHGTNICRKGPAIDLMIDEACGILDDDIKKFIDFVWEYIFLRFGNDVTKVNDTYRRVPTSEVDKR